MSSPPEIPGDAEKDMKIFLTNSCLIFISPGYGFSNFITLLTAKMNYLNEGEVAHILAYQPSRLYVKKSAAGRPAVSSRRYGKN